MSLGFQSERFKGWVIAHTTDGRRWEHIEPVNRGSFDNPMGPDDIRAKFRENASVAVTSGRIEQIIEIVDRLESLQDVKELVSLCVR